MGDVEAHTLVFLLRSMGPCEDRNWIEGGERVVWEEEEVEGVSMEGFSGPVHLLT